MAKECILCHFKIGLFASTYMTENGTVCKDCLPEIFKRTKKIHEDLSLDEARHLFMVGKKIFRYENLADYNIFENGHSVSKGGLGRAVAGGLLFGGVGAIVGGATGKKKDK